MDYIIYHKNCPDGFTAAYIAKKRYPEAELVPRDHGTPIDVQSFAGKDIICIDINLRGKNDEVAAVAKSYRVLDHHKSELAELDGKPYAIFDLTRSGAGLAWDYLFGEESLIRLPLSIDDENGVPQPTGEFLESETYPRPWYVNYVEDRDLWRFNLPNSREVNAFIMSHTYSIENWDTIANTKIDKAVLDGMVLVKQSQKNAKEVALQAQFGTWNGYRTAVVNAPYLLASDVGDILYQQPDVDVAMVWFERNDNKIQISLRSAYNGPDVGVMASSFPGGGGHAHAAGIVSTVELGRELIDKILGRTQIEQFRPRYRIRIIDNPYPLK